MECKIVKNTRTLKSLQKKYSFNFDMVYKYVTKENHIKNMYNYNKEYILKYIDGCFYPYVVQTNRKKLTSIAQLYNDNIDYSNAHYLKNNDFVVVLNRELTNNEIDFLSNKYYNICFDYSIMNEYAPEIKKKCIYVKNII